MKTKLIGLIASVALMGSGTALAGGDWKNKDQQQQTQTQSDTGGSGTVTEGRASGTGSTSQTGGSGSTTESAGQTGSSASQTGSSASQTGSAGTLGQGTQAQQGSSQQLASNEITGRVVKSNKKMVWVEHAGAVVPLKINKQTQFGDENLKRAQDIKAGDEIRASFEVNNTDNVATNIQRSDGTLGSGSDSGGSGMDTGMDTGSDMGSPDTLPPSPLPDGTGGSGTGTGSDLTPPDTGDEGTSSNLGSDASKSGDF